MGIFNAIKGFVMKILNIGTIEQATGLHSVLTTEMQERLELWAEMYAGQAPWHDADIRPCGVEKNIIGRLANPIGEEIKLKVENPAIDPVMQKLNADTFRIIEYFVFFGGCLVRPVFSNNRLQYELIPFGSYIPTKYDIDGSLTGAVITKKLSDKNDHYTLVEEHDFTNNVHTVKMRLYKNSGINGDAMREVSLETLEQTAGLTKEYKWENVERPFIIEFRNRETNRVDGTNAPCALIAGVENLIRDADKQYARLNWEQEAGETKVFADADLFRTRQGADGVKIDHGTSKLFVKLNGDGTTDQKITTFSPALRTDAQAKALQEILKRIELATNIGKGTLSDLEDVQKTATANNNGLKALYSKIDTYESEIEEKFKSCAYVFAYMAGAYLQTEFNDAIQIEYDDMSRKDPVQMKQMAMQEVNAGLMNKWEYRMKFFGEDEETAKANAPQAETQSMFGNF